MLQELLQRFIGWELYISTSYWYIWATYHMDISTKRVTSWLHYMFMTYLSRQFYAERWTFHNTNQGFLCPNLTRAQVQHCHKITLKIEPKETQSCNIKKRFAEAHIADIYFGDWVGVKPCRQPARTNQQMWLARGDGGFTTVSSQPCGVDLILFIQPSHTHTKVFSLVLLD